jgi:alpha-L-rhamnosidase
VTRTPPSSTPSPTSTSQEPVFREARWICDPAFATVAIRPVFRKNYAPATQIPHRDDLSNHHLLVRGRIDIRDLARSVTLTISADDCYYLWINGLFIGLGPAPGYPQHFYCNTYEIAPLLKVGENIIAVQVYYQGLQNSVWISADHRQGLIAELTAGTQVLGGTNGSWRQHRGTAFTALGTAGYATQFLECFDSRSHLPGWREELFDDSSWGRMHERTDHDYTFVRQPTLPLNVCDLKPQSVIPIPGGVRLDFGHELTGNLALKASGRCGDAIELRFGEELSPDGSVRFAMRCNCTYLERWILSGGSDELEQFDYKGFRYCEIIVPEGVVLDTGSIHARVRHYPLQDQRFAWVSSNPDLDSIIGMCARTLRYGAQDSILDCPTREKGAYLGDVTISGLAHLYLSGDVAYAKKGLDDYAASAAICPGLMAVAPCAFNQEIADYSLQWPIVLLRYYQHSGDLAGTRALMPVLDSLMRHFSGYQRADGLLENIMDKWTLVDWPANLRDGYDFNLTDPPQPGIHSVINAFYLAAMRDANALARVFGMPDYGDVPALREAFQRAFHRPDLKLIADTPTSRHCSLQSNVMALYADAAPAEAVDAIVDLVRAKRFSCGVYMAFFVLKALGKASQHRLIYDLLLDTGEHSWMNMLREGATTTFEAWGKEQKWNTSLCHPWACAPLPVLIEDVLGLRPGAPGWTAIAFAPRMPAEVASFSLRLSVLSGEIRIEHQHGSTTITAPNGVTVVRS